MRDGQRGVLDLPGVGVPLPFTVRRAEAGALHIAFDLDMTAAARFRPFVEQLASRRAA
jgi:hypothetical protein